MLQIADMIRAILFLVGAKLLIDHVGQKALSAVDYNFVKVGFNEERRRLTITYKIKNNSNVVLPFGGFTGTIKHGGTLIGEANTVSLSPIDAQETVLVEIDFQLKAISFLDRLSELLDNPRSILDGFVLNGGLDVGNVKIPVNRTFEFLSVN